MKKIIILIFLLVLYGCKEAKTGQMLAHFYFDNPQPVNDSELSSIPSKFRGVFAYGSDNQLYIGKEYIYDSHLEGWRIAKTALDSLERDISYKDGKLIMTEGKYVEQYNMKDEGDSIYLYNWRNDTVFRFSPTQKAKRINGQLVLSIKDSLWEVWMLSVHKDTLYWKGLINSSDYINLKPLVEDITINPDTNYTPEAYQKGIFQNTFAQIFGYYKV